jgi:hypothetical protein
MRHGVAVRTIVAIGIVIEDIICYLARTTYSLGGHGLERWES